MYQVSASKLQYRFYVNDRQMCDTGSIYSVYLIFGG